MATVGASADVENSAADADAPLDDKIDKNQEPSQLADRDTCCQLCGGCLVCLCVSAFIQVIFAAATAHNGGIVWAVVLLIATCGTLALCIVGRYYTGALAPEKKGKRYGVCGAMCCVLCPLAFITIVFLFINVLCAVSAHGWEAFPDACKQLDDSYGCTRISVDRSQRTMGLKPLLFSGRSIPEVTKMLQRWFDDPVGWPERCEWDREFTSLSSYSVVSDQTFGSGICYTNTYNFVDELGFRISQVKCGLSGPDGVLVEAQGELRMGIGDMMHNWYRLNSLWSYLKVHISTETSAATCGPDNWDITVVTGSS